MVFSWEVAQRKGDKMVGYEHLAEQIYNGWINHTEGLEAKIADLTNCKSLIMKLDLFIGASGGGIEKPSFYPVVIKASAFNIKNMKRCEILEHLGQIDNSGFADDWFHSMCGLYILLETFIKTLDAEISFEYADFERIMSAAINKLEGLDFQVAGSIYIKSKQLPELTKLKSVAGYLDRHQLDLDIFTQRNCTEGNMSEAEKYICNELIEKPGNRNLEAIVDEIRTQF